MRAPQWEANTTTDRNRSTPLVGKHLRGGHDAHAQYSFGCRTPLPGRSAIYRRRNSAIHTYGFTTELDQSRRQLAGPEERSTDTWVPNASSAALMCSNSLALVVFSDLATATINV